MKYLFLFACLLSVLRLEGAVRVATYNVSFNSREYPDLSAALEGGEEKKMHQVAKVIRMVRPEVILLAEFDLTQKEDGVVDEAAMQKKVDAFRKNYLEVKQQGLETIRYEHALWMPTNTGVPSGLDLNRNGKVGEPSDAWGYGEQNGQFGFVLLSQHPIARDEVRSFRKFLWADMPGNLCPVDYHGEKLAAKLRLSSKTHLDVPVTIDGKTVHLLLCHPTPPSFDGKEDRNGRRNFDEIRLWADYLDPARSGYLKDDLGKVGGLVEGAAFVILGDLNADPLDGDSREKDGVKAIDQLLKHPLVLGDIAPTSKGAGEQVKKSQRPETKTAAFKLRVDYVLPSKAHFTIADSGVFWPMKRDENYPLIRASDHRMVWVDLEFR